MLIFRYKVLFKFLLLFVVVLDCETTSLYYSNVYYKGVLKAKKSKRVVKIEKSVEEGLIKVIKPTKTDIGVAEGLQRN